MRHRIILFILSALISFPALGQPDTTPSKNTWFVSLHAGVLAGRKGTGSAPSLNLRQGVRYRAFSLAVGAGYDLYSQWEVLPVFAGAGYDFIRGKNHAFFVQFDVGYGKAWMSVIQDSPTRIKSEGGYFYHPLVGYRLRQGKATVYFSAGYKLQRITYEQTPAWMPWSSFSLPATKMSVEQHMERLSVHMGIGLW